MLLSKSYIKNLAQALKDEGSAQARSVLSIVAAERIEENKPHKNSLIFMAREAIDNVQ